MAIIYKPNNQNNQSSWHQPNNRMALRPNNRMVFRNQIWKIINLAAIVIVLVSIRFKLPTTDNQK